MNTSSTLQPAALGWGAELRAMLMLAWPLALTNLSQVALVLTDTIFLGHLGELPLAAATLGGNLHFIAMALPFGLAFAATAMMAQERGRVRRHMREMRRTFRQAVWLGAAVYIPIALLLWNSAPILRATGQQADLAEAAQTFTRAMMWGLFPFYGFMLLRGFLSALERPRAALWVSLAAVGLNAVLSYTLVLGAFGIPSLGVLGAGIASATSNIVMFVGLAVLVSLDRRFSRFRLAGRFWRTDWHRMAELLRIGLPIAGTMLLEIGIFSGTALIMGWFGSMAVAAHAVALQTASACFMIPMGISQAATARVGLAAGASNAIGVRLAGWTAIGLAAAFMAVTATLLFLFPERLAALFLAPELEDTRRLAATLLIVAGLFQLADGVQVAAAGALRGLKDTRLPLLFAALGYWGLGLPFGLLLVYGVGLGPLGIWLGLAAGLAIVAVLMTWRWRVLTTAAA
ncbi:putative multidrug efflux protein NorM [Acetobacteraceae bacterium AT-5844]|nr:putative multidrug efflux protein NorM [Acetobacteraceae bacterium AT-5844]